MTANQPLVAAWLSAPPGTSTAIATQPAGALQAPSYVLEGGDGTTARVQLGCSRSSLGNSAVALSLSVGALQPVNELLVTQADVTFRIAAPIGTVFNVYGVTFPACNGDGNAIWVDLDDDGTIDFDSGERSRRAVTRVAGSTPLAIRVHSNWIAPQVLCSSGCSITVQAWHPAAQPAGEGCGNVSSMGSASGVPLGTTNYQMYAIDRGTPNSWLELIAFGTGSAGFFLFDQQSTTVPVALPQPWSITCPALANPFVAIPAGIPGSFVRLFLPLLPPGQVFYAQHAAFSMQAPFGFGTSNRIRLQS